MAGANTHSLEPAILQSLAMCLSAPWNQLEERFNFTVTNFHQNNCMTTAKQIISGDLHLFLEWYRLTVQTAAIARIINNIRPNTIKLHFTNFSETFNIFYIF